MEFLLKKPLRFSKNKLQSQLTMYKNVATSFQNASPHLTMHEGMVIRYRLRGKYGEIA